MPFAQKNYNGVATDSETKFDDMFIHFDRMYERDRHTHTDTGYCTQTPHDDIRCACIASRGKTGPLIFI